MKHQSIGAAPERIHRRTPTATSTRDLHRCRPGAAVLAGGLHSVVVLVIVLIAIRRGRPSFAVPRRGQVVTGTSNATHSMCWVIGKQSYPRSSASRQPSSANVATSRAKAAGSHAT